MKVYINNYKLIKRNSAEVVPTVLLKFKFQQDLIGYSSLHMWPKLGDPKTSVLLNELSHYKHFPFESKSQTLKNISQWAYADALARKQGINLLDKVSEIKSHFLISDVNQDLQVPDTETLFKIKYQKTDIWLNQVKQLGGTLRIDFNAQLSCEEFIELYRNNICLFKRVEFVEDPCHFSLSEWERIKRETDVKLALDFFLEENLFKPGVEKVVDIVVIKPQTDPVEQVLQWCNAHGKKYLFTSYMDHPVGQAHAARIALKHISPECLACGLSSENVYEKNEFSQQLQFNGSIENEVGVGFTGLLEKCSWELISEY